MSKCYIFSNQILKKIFIILIIILSFLAIYDLIFNKKVYVNKELSRSTQENKVKIKSIDFFSLATQEKIGSIKISNNDVVLDDCSQKNECEILQTFVDQNHQDWLTSGITYSVGGCDKYSCWDGTETSLINDPDFINGLYSVLDESFSDQYSISVTKEEVR